jgi:hypothetical protein
MTGFTNGKPVFEGMFSHTYETLAPILGKEPTKIIKESRAQMYLCRTRDGHGIQVVLDKTPIVVHWPGSFVIDNGGWYGSLSKRRMNEFMPPGWNLWQSNFFWYLHGESGVHPYQHHMLCSDGGQVSGERAYPQHLVTKHGRDIPAYTIEEYMNRAVTVVVHWVMNHVFVDEDGNPFRNDDHYLVGEILVKAEESMDAIADIRSATDGTDMLAAILNLSHMLHVNSGGMGAMWGHNGHILDDYGRKYGLPRRLIQVVSEGADRYFSQEHLDEFCSLDRDYLPRVPVYSL